MKMRKTRMQSVQIATSVSGSCQCAVGYESADCSVTTGQPPYIHELPKYGLCDTRYMNCQRVIVYGKDFVDSAKLECHLQECQVRRRRLVSLCCTIPEITMRYVSRYFVNAQTNRLSGSNQRSLKSKGPIMTSYCVLKQYRS